MIPAHVESYLRTMPRTYTEEQHGRDLHRLAVEITRRADARYRARLHGAVSVSLLIGMAVGFGVALVAL